MISARMKAGLVAGFSSMSVFGLALASKAADYSASTTAAITSAGESILSMFFTNLPVILGFVIAVVLTLWGVRWVMSLFHRGGRK